MTIERAAVDSDESKRLVAELWAEVDRIYGNPDPTMPDSRGMDAPEAAFLIARDGARPIGCVGLRPIAADIAEVKRLYVQPGSRRAGVARRLMEALEAEARAAGFKEIWLETGLGQPAAITLYESLGYEKIASFGEYAHDPVSVCYGKRLT
ncbi:MAG TPA: GNAT family N-acetyltransferase [Chthoniobacterales bacterium]|nr:GNAT family N-acetyltransferase [Chthoniobacterales bacterium]